MTNDASIIVVIKPHQLAGFGSDNPRFVSGRARMAFRA